jgi:cytochrome c-type biogenesis protein
MLARPQAALRRNALGFVLGFALVFVTLGVGAGLIGRGLASDQRLLARLGGVLVAGFGLMQIGLLRLPWAEREHRLRYQPAPQPGLAGSTVFGAVFAFAWTPCIGPTLGAILTLALTSGGTGRAAVLLSAYSAGLALPFLAAALLAGRTRPLLQALVRHARGVQVASGAFMVLIGVLVFFGLFTALNQYFAGAGLLLPL